MSSHPNARPLSRRRCAALSIAALACGVLGCTGESEAVVRKHPDPSRYTVDLESANHLTKDTTATDGSRPFLRLGDELTQVGELDEPSEYVLGEIRAVSRDTAGDLVVLDAPNHSVRYYDAEGGFLFAAGGPGEGPGELMSPNALALDGWTTYVTDLRTLRVTAFERGGGDSIMLAGTYELGTVTPYDMCALDDVFVVHGRNMQDGASGPLLHVFDQQFQPLHSFGEIYDAGHPSIQRGLSAGRVLCIPPDRVVLAPAGLPVVVGYSRDGRTAWTTLLEDYTPFEYIQYPDRIENSFPEGGGSFLAGLAPAPNGWLLVQVARRTMASMEEGRSWDTLDTYAIRSETGRGLYLGSRYPLLSQVTDSTAIAVRELPYPRLSVHGVEAVFPPGTDDHDPLE